MQKLALPFGIIALMSGGVFAYGLCEEFCEAPAVSPLSSGSADFEPPIDEEEVEFEESDELTLDDCLAWQDPRDPSIDPARDTSHDDEFLDAAINDKAFADEFVIACDALSNATPDRAQQIQAQYAVARFENALDRNFDAKERLEKLADEHASSAWRLSQLITQGVMPELTESNFDTVLDLVLNAYKGGDARAEGDARNLMGKLLPLDKMQMPTLVSSVHFGRVVPDSLTTRKAMISYFDGYVEYCRKWSHIVIAPAEGAAVQNARLNLQAGNIGPALQQLPQMLRVITDWSNNLNNKSLIDMMRDWNTAAATPAQMLFVVDKAAARDGYMHAEAMGCTSKRAGATISKLIDRIKIASQSVPPPPVPAHIEMLAQPVDVLDYI